MDVWILFTPVLKIFLYAASLIAAGTMLFTKHFDQFQSAENVAYCNTLTLKASGYGMVFSIGALFSVAGNLGGELWSILDPTMRSIAVSSKAGTSAFLSFLGFFFMAISTRYNLRLFSSLAWLGVFFLLLSFVWMGHAQKAGLIAQVALFFHLIGLSFWLGSFLPLHNMCSATQNENLHETAHRFGVFAVFYVALLIFSGLLFIYLLMDDLSLLLSTTYGNVFLIKMAFVASLLGFGAINKFQLVPSIKNEPSVGRQRLKKSIQYEIFIALSILLLTSVLTTSTTLPMGG